MSSRYTFFCFMMMIENYRSIQQFPTKGNQSFDNFSHIKLCVLLWVLGKTKWGFLHLCLSIKNKRIWEKTIFQKISAPQIIYITCQLKKSRTVMYEIHTSWKIKWYKRNVSQSFVYISCLKKIVCRKDLSNWNTNLNNM